MMDFIAMNLTAMSEAVERNADLNNFNEEEFLTVWCMIAEEYCKANNLDVRELANTALDAIIDVNELLGNY